MNLILPVAGMSSRFPGVKPKWLLTHPNGNLMIIEAIKGLDFSRYDKIYLITVQEHLEKYNFIEGLKKQFSKFNQLDKLKIIVLDKHTNSQPETVAKAIIQENIHGQIYIKDSDNFFIEETSTGNFVSTFDLNNMDLVHAKNKSYVVTNDQNIITNIVEKKVVSSIFNVGGYGFESALEFLKYYEELKDKENLYISHIIYKMMLDKKQFKNSSVKEYIDWGTIKEWNMYKSQYVTLFLDIDGTLVENSGEYFSPIWGETKKIKENVEIINRLYESEKVNIILTTSRKSEYEYITKKQLERENIKYHQIIFNLHHAKRIVVNDYAPSNPYKSCDAINIKRNSSDLKEMLEESLGFRIN
jgi:hypothetical protein